MNTETGAVSEYSLQWESVASINGVVHGVDQSGTYKLDGPIEEGCVPYIKTGVIDLASGSRCNAKLLWLTCRTEKGLVVTVTADVNGTPVVCNYNVGAFPGASLRERTERLGRGVDADLWTFRIEAPNGGTWDQKEAAVDLDNVRHPR